MKKDENPINKSYGKMFFILLTLLVASMVLAFVLGAGASSEVIDYNTAYIKISGPLYTSGGGGLFDDSTNSEEIVKLIEKASKDSNVQAVIFEINSPGGSPVATDEIANAIKMLQKENITTVAFVREVGASGAYWVASATDHVIANRMSIVGSIGVYGSYLEWYGLMNRYNVTYKRLVSGEYKDSGTPYRPMSKSEEELIQMKLDKLHEYFIEAVADNRDMKVEDVRILATGEIFLGIEAKENGLVDELGGKDEAIAYIQRYYDENYDREKVKLKQFNSQKSLLESLMSAMNKNSFYIGEGIGSGIIREDTFEIQT